jgi:hypothetical protein
MSQDIISSSTSTSTGTWCYVTDLGTISDPDQIHNNADWNSNNILLIQDKLKTVLWITVLILGPKKLQNIE